MRGVPTLVRVARDTIYHLHPHPHHRCQQQRDCHRHHHQQCKSMPLLAAAAAVVVEDEVPSLPTQFNTTRRYLQMPLLRASEHCGMHATRASEGSRKATQNTCTATLLSLRYDKTRWCLRCVTPTPTCTCTARPGCDCVLRRARVLHGQTAIACVKKKQTHARR